MIDWDGKMRTFRQLNSRIGQARVWSIRAVDGVVYTTWGVLGGAMQTAAESHIGVNKGKKNEMKPTEYALNRALEQIRKKRREGYREHDADGNMIEEAVTVEIDFDKTLPDSFCFYKPDNDMGAGMLKKSAEGKLVYSVKRNGLAHILVRPTTGSVQIYSRRMHRQHDNEIGSQYTWDDRFPHIVEQANRIIPPRSIVPGELFIRDHMGRDSMKTVESYTKSLTPKSLEDQARDGLPSFYIWDIGFWAGENLVSNVPVRERYEIIHEIEYFNAPHFEPVEWFEFESPEAAREYAKKKGLEGFVAVDLEGVYGDKAFNFRGKPDRPAKFCSKVKPEYEDDFVVYWDPHHGHGEASTKGRYATADKPGIGSVSLYQYNKAGELIYISNCASGMTEEMRRDMANPALFPQVWRVAYTSRTYMSEGDDTNALQFPRLDENGIRSDKKPAECVNTRL